MNSLHQKKKKNLDMINTEWTNLKKTEEHGNRISQRRGISYKLITRFLQQINFKGGRNREREGRIGWMRESSKRSERVGKGRRERERQRDTQERKKGGRKGFRVLKDMNQLYYINLIWILIQTVKKIMKSIIQFEIWKPEYLKLRIVNIFKDIIMVIWIWLSKNRNFFSF